MRTLLCLAVLAWTGPALAQEEHGEGIVAASVDPGSDGEVAARGSSPNGPRRRAQAFLVPMDEGARIPTTRVSQAVEKVLSRTPRYEVVDLGRALSVESTAEQAQRAEVGRRLLAEGDSAAGAKSWPEAAGKYRRALGELYQALPAVTARDYAEAALRFGTAALLGGQEGQATAAFALAARLDPQHRLAPDDAAAARLEAARAELPAAKRGMLEVEVRPAGARIFVDGEPRSATVELPAGRHLLRVERTGFYPFADLVDLTPRKPNKQSITLAATPTAASLSQWIAGASEEAGRGAVAENVALLAEKFSLERVLIGSVRSQERKSSVALALVDAPHRRLIGTRTVLVAAGDAGSAEIEAATVAAVRALVAADEEQSSPQDVARIPPAASAEPKAEKKKDAKKRPTSLRGKTGTEDWNDDE